MKKFSTNYFIGIILIHVLFISCNSENPISGDSFNPQQGIQFEWPASTPSALGLDSLRIESALTIAESYDFLHGILIIKDGQIAAEKYSMFNDTLSWHSVASVTKSFSSALIGIAVDQGHIQLNQKAVSFFQELVHQEADNRIRQITIEQLLQMRSGIRNDTYFGGRESAYSRLTEGILNEPLAANPGEYFIYSSNGVYLLTAILSKATGKDALIFANQYLFEPMGISCAWWDKSQEGYYYGGSGMFFSLRNMAAFGQLYINKGKLNGRQIISEDWINRSMVNHVNGGGIGSYGYGYLWWLDNINGNNVFYAEGWGGQLIFCAPEINMMVVTTANSNVDSADSGEQTGALLQLIADYILPTAN